tara:strand:+ start:840 stop:2876 length:2037 start_codon:yes stop_codon:yes gene_type:complete
MNKKVAAIIQARTDSTRLPNKVLANLGGKTLIGFLIERVKKCKEINEIILATTNNKSDDVLAEIANDLNIKIFRGDENDVLFRYYKASLITDCNFIVRITGDCPLIDPSIISETIKNFFYQNVDYLSNCFPPSFPDGLDVEVFSKEVLFNAQKDCNNKNFREHVTQWIREQDRFKIGTFKSKIDYSSLRWTVDEPEDLEVIRFVVKKFKGLQDFSWEDVIILQQKYPEIFKKNKRFARNEGSKINTGQKLYKRAKKVIPGGNMLLSKRPEMFLPNGWPAYFSKSKGCRVWDLDGNEFIDMSIMGIGTNILGYSNDEVDKAVIENIKKGNMSSLNCPEEVKLAEKLISMHSWSDMVRFARSGGEANAIAVRIARACSGKDKVAICGYHGWHDWYLATNLQNKSGLKDHLLPGLEPIGVPKSLEGSVIPFKYNDLEELKNIVQKYDLAAIKMEVERSIKPKKGFLEGVRELCDQKGIVLIFDECTSGFRETFGGLHLKYGVYPDMAMFGKALGNGFAITAVLGKRSVMEHAQNTFISSTFWTERAGSTAALKTLEIMERESTWDLISKNGKYARNLIYKLSKKYKIEINLSGLDPLICYQFKSKNNLKYKTYITQEMLKKGYLASNLFYLCIDHTEEIINDFIENLDLIFEVIGKCENGTQNIDNLLVFDVCHSGFQRLN